MSIRRRRIESRASADGEDRQVRDSNGNFVSFLELLRRRWELDVLSILKSYSANSTEDFFCVFPLGLNDLGGSVKLNGYAEESAIFPGCVFLQVGDDRATRLRHDLSQFRIRRAEASQGAAVFRH